jgi:hypothetical protein
MRLFVRKESFFFYFKTPLISLVFCDWFIQSSESQSYSTGHDEMNVFQSTQKSNIKLMRRNKLFAQSLKSLLFEHPRCVSKPSMSGIRVALSVASKMQVTRARWPSSRPSRRRNRILYQSVSISQTPPSSINPGLVRHRKLHVCLSVNSEKD